MTTTPAISKLAEFEKSTTIAQPVPYFYNAIARYEEDLVELDGVLDLNRPISSKQDMLDFKDLILKSNYPIGHTDYELTLRNIVPL